MEIEREGERKCSGNIKGCYTLGRPDPLKRDREVAVHVHVHVVHASPKRDVVLEVNTSEKDKKPTITGVNHVRARTNPWDVRSTSEESSYDGEADPLTLTNPD